MSDEGERIVVLFCEALDREPCERESFLNDACKGDTILRVRLAHLLENHQAELRAPRLEKGPLNVSLPEPDPLIGTQAGPFELRQRLGEGGMATVYLAVRKGQINQTVAIKRIKPGLHSEDVLHRFRQEGQVLAALSHANIAQLHDGGMTSDGQPYFAMEYVEGQPINVFCDQHRLSTAERLKLFRQVCDAVQYAHQGTVIHRDLKPGNILVTANGTAKVIDFGIAKLINPQLGVGPGEPTRTGESLMTPEYASPEQVCCRPITTTSDVYSLGVLLYELLTGHLPHRFPSALQKDIERIVCEENPEKPSKVISREFEESRSGSIRLITPALVARVREGHPDALRKRLQGDIDNIVLMALRKEPNRRYQSARELAEDIDRHLNGFPVKARGNSAWYRASKFVRRHRVLVGSGFALAALSMVSIILINDQRKVAEQARVLAERKQESAEHESRVATSLRFAAQARLVDQKHPQRRLLLAIEAMTAATRAGLRIAEAEQSLRDALEYCSGYPLWGHSGEVSYSMFTPDSRWALTGSGDGFVQLWDLTHADPVQDPISIQLGSILTSLALSKSGNWFAAAFTRHAPQSSTGFSTTEGILGHWDLRHIPPWPSPVFLCVDSTFPYDLTYSSDERSLLASSGHGAIRLWDLNEYPDNHITLEIDGIPLSPADAPSDMHVAPDGRFAIALADSGACYLWDLRADKARHNARRLPVTSSSTENSDRRQHRVMFSDTGRWLLISSGKSIGLWNLETQDTEIAGNDFPPHIGAISCAAFGKNDQSLAIGTETGGVYLWPLPPNSAKPLAELQRNKGRAITSIALSPDAAFLAVAAQESPIVVGDLRTAQSAVHWLTLDSHGGDHLLFDHEGTHLVGTEEQNAIRMWRVQGDDPLWESIRLSGQEGEIEKISISPDDRWLLSTSTDAIPRIWNLAPLAHLSKTDQSTMRLTDVVRCEATGQYVASTYSDKTIYVWRRLSNGALTLQWAIKAFNHTLRGITFDDVYNKVLVWVSGEDGPAEVSVEQSNKQPLQESADHRHTSISVLTLEMPPFATAGSVGNAGNPGMPEDRQVTLVSGVDGKWLIRIDEQRVIHIMSTAAEPSRSDKVIPAPSTARMSGVAISRNGKWLVTEDKKGYVWLLELQESIASGQWRAIGKEAFATSLLEGSLAVDDSGQHVVGVDFLGTVRLWTVMPEGQPILKVLWSPDPTWVTRVQLSPSGQWLAATCGRAGTQLWNLSSADPGSTRVTVSGGQCVDFSSDDKWCVTGDSRGVIRMWPLDAQELLRQARMSVGREFTPEERSMYFPQY